MSINNINNRKINNFSYKNSHIPSSHDSDWDSILFSKKVLAEVTELVVQINKKNQSIKKSSIVSIANSISQNAFDSGLTNDRSYFSELVSEDLFEAFKLASQ